jgi:DNA-binding transcriptional MerR regulator
MADLLDIGEVADRSGMAPSTLRYYERYGIIASIDRKGLRRQYSAQVLETLAVLALCQRVGMTLAEIKDFPGHRRRPALEGDRGSQARRDPRSDPRAGGRRRPAEPRPALLESEHVRLPVLPDRAERGAPRCGAPPTVRELETKEVLTPRSYPDVMGVRRNRDTTASRSQVPMASPSSVRQAEAVSASLTGEGPPPRVSRGRGGVA